MTDYLERISSATEYESAEDFIAGECMTYNDMCELARQLLCYFADYEHEELMVRALAPMIGDYLAETM